jgi:protein-tyrosine-phosphatase
MAEALLNAHNNAGLVAASAGTKPRGEVHSIALDVLRGHGHATDGLRSKSFTTICAQTGPDWDYVFTVCDSAANQDNPPVGGAPITSHWSTIDPVPAVEAQQTPELIRAGFEQCYDLLKSRIARFSTLPFDTASRSELQNLVDGIALKP